MSLEKLKGAAVGVNCHRRTGESGLSTVRRLIGTGRLRAIDVGGGKRRHYRIDPRDLTAIDPSNPPPLNGRVIINSSRATARICMPHHQVDGFAVTRRGAQRREGMSESVEGDAFKFQFSNHPTECA